MTNFNFYFSNRKSAEEVLTKMVEMVNEHGVVAVADFYDLVEHPSVCAGRDGWFSLEGAYVEKLERDCYVINFPDPKDIKTLITVEPVFEKKPVRSGRYPWGEDVMVTHPPHYQSETGMEVIDVIEAFTFDLKGIEATDTGNILKYICRWKHKNGLQDLKKAQWYLNHLINHVDKLEKENN